MRRKIIAVDLDDVLSQSAEGFAAFSNQRWGKGHHPDNYLEEWAVFWNVPLEEALRRSKEFHESDAVASYRHFEYALPVLQRLRKHYELVIVTSRQTVLRRHTEAWLDTYFAGIFNDVRYAGIWDKSHQAAPHEIHKSLARTKAEICRELAAGYLIDDQPKHCIGAAQAGMQALLFGDYAWNRTVTLPGQVIRVRDWAAVQEYFDAAR